MSALPTVGELIEMLSDPSWVVRRTVVRELADLGEKAAPAMIEALIRRRDNEARIAALVDSLSLMTEVIDSLVIALAGDADPAVVADAAQILGRKRSQLAVSCLVQLTRHADDNVAVAAIEALGRIGGRAAVEALVASVKSGNFFRTFPAIDVLGRSGDPRAVAPLAELLNNPSFVPEAARALGHTGERAAIPPLLGLLSSSSDVVVRLAANAVWELREKFAEKSGGNEAPIDELLKEGAKERVSRLVRAASGTSTHEVVAICRLLGILGRSEATSALTSLLDAPPAIATAAAQALKNINGRIDGKVDDSLGNAIRDGSSARRKVLLPEVSMMDSATDVTVCLTDPDREVRALACEALARLGNAKIVSSIFPLLADSNLRVVHAATAAIQALGSREARDLAVQASESPEPNVRRAALRILSYYGDDAFLPPLVKGLRDQDSRVREAALQGLPYLENPLAIETLIEAAKDSSERTRSLAMRSLGLVPKANERVRSILLGGLRDADSWVRYFACQSLGRFEDATAATEIIMLLNDEAGQVRVSAVEALSHLEIREAREALKAAAISPDVEIRRAALVGLGISHRPEDLPVVIEAASADDLPTRLIALSALVAFASPLVVGILASAASGTEEQTRSTAVKLLAARQEGEATEVLVELLRSHDESTRERAKAALVTPSEGRLPTLLQLLDRASDDEAAQLVAVLARLEPPDARNGLINTMSLQNPAARKAAASGLAARMAARHDPDIVALLENAATHDPDPEVRKVCSLLLKEA